MFLCGVARPRFEDNICTFDGKIGIWPFLEPVPAKKASKNRAKGTIELKPVNITKPTYREMLTSKLLPAIRDRWPDGNTVEVVIQQDNARPHIDPNDQQFYAEATRLGLRIKLLAQPPNSPDTNVNDLGFFRAIQSKQHQNSSNTIEELRDAVVKASWEMPPYYLNKVWLSLQQCMIETLNCDGNNNYKLPHLKKDQLFRQRVLPQKLSFDKYLYQSIVDKFITPEIPQEAPVQIAPPPTSC